jgi:hypothetical protein
MIMLIMPNGIDPISRTVLMVFANALLTGSKKSSTAATKKAKYIFEKDESNLYRNPSFTLKLKKFMANNTYTQ